mmetsp:Transcript_20330/g.30528  ORF Transcript_20330/g.30528 Transcript_20330/m.30528 type:complete len:594 (+) Transcript_20330:76-1857(+)
MGSFEHELCSNNWGLLFVSDQFDIPSALHEQLKDYLATTNGNVDDKNYAMKFNLLYSVYSVPNIILPFFSGTVIDSLGAHYSALIFVSLLFIGQSIFASGVQTKNYNIMLLGRLFYGFGGSSAFVANNTLNSIWFQGKELALAFGINLAVGRMGTVANNWISPTIANSISTPLAFWFGACMNFVSVTAVCVIIYFTIIGKRWFHDNNINSVNNIDGQNNERSLTSPLLEDWQEGGNTSSDDTLDGGCVRTEEGNIREMGPKSLLQVQGENKNADNQNEQQHSAGNIEDYEEVETPSNINQSKFSIMFWILCIQCAVVYACIIPFNNILSGLLLERNYFKSPPSTCMLTIPDQCTSGSLAPSAGNPSIDESGNTCPLSTNVQPILPTSIHVKAVDGFDHKSYEFENLTSNDVDCSDEFWSKACTKDYCAAQQRATETGGRVMSIPYILSAILSPFIGYAIDRIGYRANCLCLAPALLMIVHLVFALTDSSPVIPLVGQGLAYALYAAVVWPSVPLTVSGGSGTAFGIITAIQNFSLAGTPLLVAAINAANHDSYLPNVEFFFIGCAALGIIFGILLNVFDRRSGGALNKTNSNT